MNPEQFERLIKSFPWHDLERIRGSAHSSIIGFVSLNWLASKEHTFVLDTAPSHRVGRGRKGMRFADILLCKSKKTVGVVEVESATKYYPYKLDTLYKYLNNHRDFADLEFGLLLMLNYPSYRHSWENIKSTIRRRGKAIGLISFTKREDNTFLDESQYSRLLGKQGYFHWLFNDIQYWFYSPSTKSECQGSLFSS